MRLFKLKPMAGGAKAVSARCWHEGNPRIKTHIKKKKIQKGVKSVTKQKKQRNFLTVKNLRQRILLIFGILTVIRLINQIPTPGVNTDYLKSFFETDNTALGFLDLMTGGSLSSLSVLALNITPYITTTIVLELLSQVFPTLQEMKKDGKHGEKAFKKVTFYSALVFTFVEAIAMGVGFGKRGMLTNYTWYWILIIALIWTVSSGALVFVGNMMSEKKLCNGISMILACNILSGLLGELLTVAENLYSDKNAAVGVLRLCLWSAVLFLMVVFVVYLTSGKKELKITNSNNYKAKTIPMATRSSLPIPVSAASVIPVIFTSTIYSIPSLIGLVVTPKAGSVLQELISYTNTAYWFQTANLKYTAGWFIYAAMVLFFNHFYTGIVLNENTMAENLQISGSQIPGIRPGIETVYVLRDSIRYTTFWGGVGIAIVVTVPMIISGFFHIQNISLMGTSLVIIVGVIMENIRQLKADTSQFRLNNIV